MKGVLAFDIDGTLTHRLDWISPEVVDFLHHLADQDWKIALFTGRIFSFAEKIFQHLNFPYILSVQNGADILTMPDKSPLKRNYLDASILPQIEEAYAGQTGDFIIYAGIDKGDFCYFRTERFSKKMLDYLKKLESLGAEPWRPSDFSLEGETFPLIKCFGEKGGMTLLHEKLKTNPSIEVSLIRDPVDPSLYLNLITHPEANKGKAVHFLRDYFQPTVIIGAGDDHNDLKMLREADIAIAIETAPEEVLAEADVIAASALNLGIIKGVEEAISLAHG